MLVKRVRSSILVMTLFVIVTGTDVEETFVTASFKLN